MTAPSNWWLHIEDVHEEVWCRKNLVWQTYRVVNLAIFSTLWRYIADVLKMCMKKFDAEKMFFDKQYAGDIK